MGGELLLRLALLFLLLGFGFFAAVGLGEGGEFEGTQAPVVEVGGAELQMDDGAGPGDQRLEALFFSAGTG